MEGKKIGMFMTLAGQKVSASLRTGTPEERTLGAHLLLSEVLEYIIKGLGVVPEIDGHKITDPEAVHYAVSEDREPAPLEMLDGLADVAYTMYWNALVFGLPLEEGFDLVCDNNLEKFVKLDGWERGETPLDREEWHCGCGITWPADVTTVEVIRANGGYYAVGKDARRKVRKPSSYRSVDLLPVLRDAA